MSSPAGPPGAPAGAPPGLPPVPPIIAEITSPLIFGILFSWALYGVLTVQVYIYHLCFPSDKRTFKILVYSVFFLDSLQTALTGADAWYWFGAGFGNMIKLSNPYISAFDTPMLGSLISLIVQWFFCYRIWTLSKSLPLAGFIASVSLMQVVAAFISGIRGVILGNFAAARAHIDLVALYIWLIGSAVADVLVAVSMTWFLMRARREEHKRSSDMLYRIVRLTVETNSLSAGIAVISLILYFSSPTTNYFICPTFFLGKIYSNTLLVAFNNRFFLTQNQNQNQSTNYSSSGRGLMSKSVPTTGVHVQSQSITLGDGQTYTDSYKMDEIERGVDVHPSPAAKSPNRGFGL